MAPTKRQTKKKEEIPISLGDLCSLLCCPPCPSNIVRKMAFMPCKLMLPSYRIITDDDNLTSLELIEGCGAQWPLGEDGQKAIEVFFTQTKRRNKIACMFMRPSESDANFTLLISHGNSEDLGRSCLSDYLLGLYLKCNIFAYDYSGYGCSGGKPSEKNLYADIAAALQALENNYQIPPQRVILYGRSIGTVPSVDLASKNPQIAGLVLQAPLSSAFRVMCPKMKRTWCCDSFPSIDKIHRVRCPTLVIHGVKDEVIDVSNGFNLYKQCPTSVKPLWIKRAGHNDLPLYQEFWDRLKKFVDDDMIGATDSSSKDELLKAALAEKNLHKDIKGVDNADTSKAEMVDNTDDGWPQLEPGWCGTGWDQSNSAVEFNGKTPLLEENSN